MTKAKDALSQNNSKALKDVLDDVKAVAGSGSLDLYLLESGRLQAIKNDTPASIETFTELGQRLEKRTLEASLTASNAFRNTAALLTNDKARAYGVQLYERIFFYYYQTLNYLRIKDFTEARITLNKALRDIRWANENLPKLRERVDRQLSNSGVSAHQLPPELKESSHSDSPSYDNPLVYFLSGLLYEASGDLDRAEIDYRNAYANAPKASFLKEVISGLKAKSKSPETGHLVIIHEAGWVSAKVPFSLPVYIKNRMYTLSFPYYSDDGNRAAYPQSRIIVEGAKPELIPFVNVDSMVREAHQEAFSGILLRQTLRILAKQEIQAKASDVDPLLGIGSALLSLLSDQPDLRSWLSLPSAVWVADMKVPAGIHSIQFTDDASAPVSINVPADGVTIVHIFTVGSERISFETLEIPNNL